MDIIPMIITLILINCIESIMIAHVYDETLNIKKKIDEIDEQHSINGD